MIQGYLFGMDVTDPALKTPQNYEEFAWFGKTLSALMPVLAPFYGTDALQAISAEGGPDQDPMNLGKLQVAAEFQHPFLPLKGNGVVLAARIGEEEYFLLCYQCAVSLMAGDARHLDILEFEEGSFEDGRWKKGRRLNGDEVASLTVEEPRLFRVKIHTYNDL